MVGFGAIAQSPTETKREYSFTLNEAINHALTNNYKAINAGRDIEIAKQRKRETTAMGLPQIGGNISYNYNFVIPLNVLPAKILDPTAPEGTFAAVAFSPKQSVNGVATLNQLIFDGSYIVALQAAKTYLRYFENAKNKANVDVREMVIRDYGNVLLAEESITIFERNKTILEKTLSDTRETFKNGLIEEENVEQLQITFGNLNNNLNNAKQIRDIAYKMLKITLGIDLNTKLTLTENLDKLMTADLAYSLAQNEFSIEQNTDHMIAKNFQEQRALELKLQKSKYLPSLSANANFGYNAFGQDFQFFANGQKYYNFSTLGVSLNIPIFSGFARSARTDQAKIALEQATTQLTEAQQRLQLQYENRKSQFEYSIEAYQISKSNLQLAERIENKQQLKFTEGLSTSFDFAEAQRQLYTAQQNFLQSMVDIINNKAALESAISQN